jgi:glycosyltransferase involved in cell wall biosynthesis
MRIGILVSHPIQYYTPLFREVAWRIDLHVFYATRGSPEQQARAGFGVEFEWDIDLLSGYAHSFLENVSTAPGPNSFFACDTPEIRPLISKGEFDAFIVFGWYLKAHWQAIRACRRYKVPVLARGDSQLGARGSTLRALTKEITHGLALRQFDGFLSVGERNREYLLHYGVPENRIFFSPHFVDNEWFSSHAARAIAARDELRESWSVNDKTFVVLFVGKFITKKRPLDLVRALGILVTERIDLVGLFVGSGAMEAEMRQLSAELNVRSHFAGFRNQTEMPAYYVTADVLVLPSDARETWGLVVNEGMACGLPAIVSDAVGCAPDLIEEATTGFTFPLGDVAGLAKRLRHLSEMKRGGFDFVTRVRQKISHYSVEAAAEGLVDGAAVTRSHWHRRAI